MSETAMTVARMLETVAGAWAATWPAALLKGALLLLLAWGVAGLLRRRSAAVRHLVWTVALAGVVLLPLLGASGLRLRLPLPSWTSPFQATASPAVSVAVPSMPIPAAVREAATSPTAAPVLVPEKRVAATRLAVPASWRWRPSAGAVAFLVWLAGALLALGAILLSLARVRLLEARARPVRDERVRGRARALARRIGIGREVRLLEAGGAMPMTWGLARPALLLPVESARWPAERLEPVLLHELAHVRRGDVATQLLAELAVALAWPNPLVWWAARRLRQERELACDDVVLSHGARASDYAAQLLEVARSLRVSRAASLAAMAMARPSQLKGRLTALLDGARSHAATTPRQRALGLALGLVVLVPLAAAVPRAAPAQGRAGAGGEPAARAAIPGVSWAGAPVLPSDTPPPARRPARAPRPARVARPEADTLPPTPPAPPVPPAAPVGAPLPPPAIPGVSATAPTPPPAGVPGVRALPPIPPAAPAAVGGAPPTPPPPPAGPVGTFRGVAPTPPPPAAGPVGTFRGGAPTPPAPPAAPAAPAALRFPCGSGRSHSTSMSVDDRRQTLRWKTDDCTVTASIEGKPRLAADLSGFTKVDGPIELTQETRGERRVLQITAGAGNAPHYAYTLNGAAHAFDAPARQWLRGILTVLVRQGGMFADRGISSLQRPGVYHRAPRAAGSQG